MKVSCCSAAVFPIRDASTRTWSSRSINTSARRSMSSGSPLNAGSSCPDREMTVASTTSRPAAGAPSRTCSVRRRGPLLPRRPPWAGRQRACVVEVSRRGDQVVLVRLQHAGEAPGPQRRASKSRSRAPRSAVRLSRARGGVPAAPRRHAAGGRPARWTTAVEVPRPSHPPPASPWRRRLSQETEEGRRRLLVRRSALDLAQDMIEELEQTEASADVAPEVATQSAWTAAAPAGG